MKLVICFMEFCENYGANDRINPSSVHHSEGDNAWPYANSFKQGIFYHGSLFVKVGRCNECFAYANTMRMTCRTWDELFVALHWDENLCLGYVIGSHLYQFYIQFELSLFDGDDQANHFCNVEIHWIDVSVSVGLVSNFVGVESVKENSQ